MKWPKRLFIIVLVVVAVVVGLPFLIPLNVYIPELEKMAGEKIQQPVRIESLRIQLVPLPHVSLQKVIVGAGQDIRIDTINVTPVLGTLFSPVKVLKEIKLDGVTLNQEIVGGMPAWFKPKEGPQTVRIETINLDHVTLESPKMKLGPYSIKINMADAGDMRNAVLTSDDGALSLEAKPVSDGVFDLRLAAQKWSVPVGPAFRFDTLNIAATADKEALHVKDIDGRLYGGTLKGATELGWKSGWKLSGNLKVKQVALGSVLPLLNAKVRMSGKLDARAGFSMKAASASQLADNPSANGDFSVSKGILHGLDLARAAQPMASGKGVRGGQTEFDELSGNFSVAGKSIRLSKMNVTSGLLNANGDVDISPSKQLGGKVYVEVKKGVSLVSVPLKVSGTLQDPSLFPTGAALTGAAVGTALLGPGLGTSLGTKAGDKIDSWFGGQKK